MQNLQKTRPSQKQIEKAIKGINLVLDKKGNDTLSISPKEILESIGLSRATYFRNFKNIDDILLFAKQDINEIFKLYACREAIFKQLSLSDFLFSLLKKLHQRDEAVSLLVRRISWNYWSETLLLIRPIITHNWPDYPTEEYNILYSFFSLAFVEALVDWQANGFSESDISLYAKKLLTSIRLMIK